jgi:hypothetical protein
MIAKSFNELEELYINFKKAERVYYQLRYQYWNSLSYLKKLRKDIDYKQYEKKCRTITKRLRRELIKTKPRGAYQLDHCTSIFECYVSGKSIEECCDIKNLKWMKKHDNQLKGILSLAKWNSNPFDTNK